jgi:hypothetical protein
MGMQVARREAVTKKEKEGEEEDVDYERNVIVEVIGKENKGKEIRKKGKAGNDDRPANRKKEDVKRKDDKNTGWDDEEYID